MVPELEPLLRVAGFDGCMAVEARQCGAEKDFLLGLVDDTHIVRSVVPRWTW